MSELIERAREIEKSLELDKLARAGFKREIRSRAQSHQTVTYPEQDTTQPVTSEEIFGKSSDRKELALYLHIPFCTGKCVYCPYVSSPASAERVKIYLSALEKEIELVSEFPEVQNSRITSAYFGGGTPTFLSPEQLVKLFKQIKRRFNLVRDAEFTVEASPETILGRREEERLDVIVRYANRLNLGVQTFDDSILAAMKRRHTSHQTRNAILGLYEKRFRNVNVDLIAGLPDQTLKVWEEDLIDVEMMRVPSITTYPLKIKPEAAIWEMFEKHPERFPGEKEVLLMHIMAIEGLGRFKRFEYTENPIWWFTRSPEFFHGQQMHKWRDNGEMIGLGVSAYSYVNDWQYYNTASLDEYLASLNDWKLPITKGARLTLEEKARRGMIFGIKCIEVDKQKFKDRYRFFPEEKFGDNLERLEKLGLVDISDKTIKLTYTGRLFSEEVARSFIEHARK
jgi:oxygen-independent coproporphyrinogen-3 oxidase